MVKKLTIAVILVLLIVTAIISWSSTTKTSQKDVSMMTQKKSADQVMNNTSSYIVYSKNSFDSTQNTRRVLFFYANWCPICITADKEFQNNKDKIPSGVTLIRVNYNDSDTDSDENELAKKYNIVYQHTFIQIDKDGNEVTRWNGGQIKELLVNIK